MDLNDYLEGVIGKSYDELKTEGAQRYPNTAPGSQHHQAAAYETASRLGFIPSQLLGLGVEGVEALASRGQTLNPYNETGGLSDTLRDLKANYLGGLEGSTIPPQPGPPSSQPSVGERLQNWLIRQLGGRTGATSEPGAATATRG